jgi:hypothetical protein
VQARKKPDDEQKFQGGDRVSVTLHTGLLVDGHGRIFARDENGKITYESQLHDVLLESTLISMDNV